MKKLLMLLVLTMLVSTPLQARPFHHGGGHHRPAPAVIYKSHHHHSGTPLIALASGLVGFAVGSAAASAAPVTYSTTYAVPANTQQCFAVVSRSTGNVTQRCLSSYNGDNQVLYVD